MLVAINRKLVNKPDHELVRKFNSEFVELDLSADQLEKRIKQGHAFCAPFTKGKRKQANFAAAGFLAVDIDRGLTVEVAVADPFFQSFASFLYTTPSHTVSAHRFRIVFELEEPIDDAENMRHALTGLVLRFGADAACTDACRIFYGSSKAEVVGNGKTLPKSQVAELIKRGKESLAKTDSNGGRGKERATLRSIVVLPVDQRVTTEARTEALLSELTIGTRVYCPQHVDEHPSAFVLRSQSGNPGLFCSSCAATFFLDDGSSSPGHTYPFNYDWHPLLSITPQEFELYADDEGYVDLSEVRGVPIRLIDTRHLAYEEPSIPPLSRSKKVQEELAANAASMAEFFGVRSENVEHRLTLIRSPKGTGKTEWVHSKVQQLKSIGASILFVGHRRSLIAASARRLGLVSYLGQDPQATTSLDSWFDDEPPDGETDTPRADRSEHVEATSYASPSSHYAICADSLPLILDTAHHRYDVVIIDEVEQVIAHLLSPTMQANRRLVLQTLGFYLRKAREIYALDADLNQVTINILSEMIPADQWSVRILANFWKPNDRALTLYKTKQHLVGELQASIGRGERCFVCSNSKRLVKSLEAKLSKDLGSACRIIAITAENAQKPEIQELIRDIRNRAVQYDLILASPALGTGIDITFANDGQHIDTVFGIFEGRINTHFDIDQQLSRVRNPKRVCVWIDPQEYHFETEVSAIRTEIEAAEERHATFMYIDDDGRRRYHRDTVYEAIFAEVTALQRASRNRLLHNFVELRQHNGWKIEDVAEDKVLRAVGKVFLDDAKAAEAEREQKLLLHARQIEWEEYETLLSRAVESSVSEADRLSMRRYEIEAFYRQNVTSELLVLDENGNLRDQIKNLELLTTDEHLLKRRDKNDGEDLLGDRPEYFERKRVLQELLQTANLLAPDGQILTSVVLKMADLRSFAEYCRDEKALIERLLDVQVRRDVMRNPVQQLGIVLRLFGLFLDRESIGKQRAKKIYKYKVNEPALTERMAIVAHRASRTSAVAAA